MAKISGGKGTLLRSNAITGENVELPTLTCAHCNRVVVLNPERTRDRHTCLKCNAYVCDNAGCNTECNPIQERLENALYYSDRQDSGPWLLCGPDGEPLFNPELRDRRRLH